MTIKFWRPRARLIFGLALAAKVLVVGDALAEVALDCGQPPQQLSREIVNTTRAKVGNFFGKITAGEVETTTSVATKELFKGVINEDKVIFAALLVNLTCQVLGQNTSLSSAEKIMAVEKLRRDILELAVPSVTRSDSITPRPAFKIHMERDNLRISNLGAPAENLEIHYVSMSWIWFQPRPCTSDGTSAVEGLAGQRSERSGTTVYTGSELRGLRLAVSELSALLNKTNTYFCNYRMQTSLKLEYDDRNGNRQRRFYRVIWGTQWAAESSFCYKINEGEFARARQAYEHAKDVGKSYDFSYFSPSQRNSAALAMLLDERRGSEPGFMLNRYGVNRSSNLPVEEPSKTCSDEA